MSDDSHFSFEGNLAQLVDLLDLDEDDEDDHLCELVDALWTAFDGEDWLDDLVNQDRGGQILRRIAEEFVTHASSPTLVACRNGDSV